MACSSCKKKGGKPMTHEELKKFTNKAEKYVIGFIIIWSVFGIYGLYRIIADLI